MNEKEPERTLKALANRRRISIIKYIRKKKEASVGEIAEAIKLSFKATSRHLAILFAADLLEKESRGLQIFYSLSNGVSDTKRKLLAIVEN